MKKIKLIALASLTIVATAVMAQIPCFVLVSHNCPGTAEINGVECNLDTGYGTTYNTMVSGSGYDAYQTYCPEYACYYNCDGGIVANGTTYVGTVTCSGFQIGNCD